MALSKGYNPIADEDGIGLMEIGVRVLEAGERARFCDPERETAFLLLDGDVSFEWSGETRKASRASLFDEQPTCLHISRGTEVTITAAGRAEVLVQKTANPNAFAPVYYAAEDIKQTILGGENMQGAAKRVLRDIFNYGNAPYSNMVLGEVLHFPGRWSSYPPHHHPQPEVYYYRFEKPQGFGVSIIGEDATVVRDGDASVIPGGLCHPQVAAPGYAMYYAWMIRHLEGNPWTDRIDAPEHAWLHEKDAEIRGSIGGEAK